MADEITIKPNAESPAPNAGQTNQSVSLTRVHVVNLCAAGLGISFFLPWANIWGQGLSGFDLQKLSDEQKLLWLIPIFSAITILAGLTSRGQKIAAILTGTLPFCTLAYWLHQLGSDLMQTLSFGAYLSLFFGLLLFILPWCLK